MDGKGRFVFCGFVIPMCFALLLLPLSIAVLEPAKPMLGWLASMEIITPGLIVTTVLIVSWARRAHPA